MATQDFSAGVSAHHPEPTNEPGSTILDDSDRGVAVDEPPSPPRSSTFSDRYPGIVSEPDSVDYDAEDPDPSWRPGCCRPASGDAGRGPDSTDPDDGGDSSSGAAGVLPASTAATSVETDTDPRTGAKTPPDHATAGLEGARPEAMVSDPRGNSTAVAGVGARNTRLTAECHDRICSWLSGVEA